MSDEMVLKRVGPKELKAYQPYLFKFQQKFWVVGIAFRVATLGWKFYDEIADAIIYEVSEVTDILYLMHGHGDISERGTPEEIFGRFGDLERFNLDVPTLTKLFRALRKEGIDFGDHLRVDEAVQSIKKHWEEATQKG